MATINAPNVEALDLKKLEAMDARSLIQFAFETFGSRAAIGTSLQKTGIVMIDVASRLGLTPRTFFLDTLQNHDETYELLRQVQQRYGIAIERFAPTDEEIEKLYRNSGQWAHFSARLMCCFTRKTLPLQRAMATMDVWLCGVRADHSEHRGENAKKASLVRDPRGRKLLKLNPLLDWTAEQVDSYTAEHDLPRNKLYDYVSPYGERYHVIGCRPCHIPVLIDCDPRAGKFPWEQGSKECGLHDQGSGI